jgi:hypothetical protein
VKILMHFCLLGIICSGAPANADFSLKVYKDAKAEGGVNWAGMRLYLLGLSDGYGYANVVLVKRHQPPLFCPPENLGLNADNVIDILEKTISAMTVMKRMSDDTVIDYTLLQGLEVTFPCKH